MFDAKQTKMAKEINTKTDNGFIKIHYHNCPPDVFEVIQKTKADIASRTGRAQVPMGDAITKIVREYKKLTNL